MVIHTKQTTLDKPICSHQNEDGNWTVEKEDDTCSTDRGDFGGVWYRCLQCDADISELCMVDNSGDALWEAENGR